MKYKAIIIAFLIIFAYACSKSTKDEDKTAKLQNKPFFLSIKDKEPLGIEKKEDGFSIKDNDKAVLFIFFTTWCPPCQAQIPSLVSIQNKFKKNLRIIGVLMEEKSNEQIDEFIGLNNINYEIAMGQGSESFAKILGGLPGRP